MESVFDLSKIKPLNPKDIDGKTLKVIVLESEGVELIGGQDIETKEIYLLSQRFVKS